jgi:hypothetical protein
MTRRPARTHHIDWDIVDAVVTDISLRLGNDPTTEDVRDYLWRVDDPEGRGINPLPGSIVTGRPDAAEFERLIISAANASAGSSEARAAVAAAIRRALEVR